MERLLYYPSFEVENEDWLKFALLYVDKLRPIVPASGQDTLSDTTHFLLEETNLYDYYRPRYEDSYTASLATLDIIDRLIRNPERYYRTFGTRSIDKKIIDSSQHNFLLYDEKYTYEFSNYCLRNGMASECSRGVLLNEKIGKIYMTILANVISEMNNFQCITDDSSMDQYNIFSRYTNFRVGVRNNGISGASKFNVAKTNINLSLPKNLKDIGLNTIVELRNSPDYQQKLKAFHNELDRYIRLLEDNKYDGNFIDYLDESMFDIKTELLQLGPTLFSFGLGVWFLFSGQANIKDIIGTTLIGGAVAASVAKIHNFRIENHDVKFTRKYLSTLQRIPV